RTHHMMVCHRSRPRHHNCCKRLDFKNSSAERKSSTVKSSDRINLPVASRRESSSSTTESNRADDNSAPIRETITMRDDEPIVLSYKRLDAGEEELYEGLALRGECVSHMHSFN